MRKNYHLIVLIFFIFGLWLTACTPEIDQAPTLAITETVKQQPSPGDISETPEIKAKFSITTEPALKAPVTLLFEAFYNGESPVFVEQDADLLVSAPSINTDIHSAIPATFLPDGVLVNQSESDEVKAFIKFALSPDGQQVLINGQYLPKNVTLIDQAGKTVALSLPIKRVLSAYGPATAIVYSVDAESRFVSASYLGARDPLGASVMEKIDPRFPEIKGDDSFSQSEFNIEEAAMLSPDLIIANARSSWLDAVDELDIPVFLVDSETPEALKEAVLLLGEIFGPHSTAHAEAWVRYFEGITQTIEEQVVDIPLGQRKKVLFTGTEPLRVVSGDMFQSYIIESVGGVSVSAGLEGYWQNVDLEQIALWNPDVIIVPPYGGASVEAITDSQEWQIIDAVQEKKVYRIPKLVAPWDTPSPDTVLGIIWMGQRLYPDRINLDCPFETMYFYKTFYDYQITEEELNLVCQFD